MMSSGDDSDAPEVKEERTRGSDDDSSDEDIRRNNNDDDDEDEDDDEEDQPQKKKKRTRKSTFLDDMANVGDDEDEEEYEEFGGEQRKEREAAEKIESQNRSGHRQYEREFMSRDAEDIAKDLEDRAARQNSYAYGGGEAQQENLLPSVRDPKLYTIPCKMGAEQETVISLMSKSVTMADQGKPLKIKSAFYKPSIRGFVYIEAFREDYVVQACLGIRSLIMFRGKTAVSSQALRLVPIKEMVQVMQASKKSAILKPGSWVRLKRGMYSGDLAQVVDPDEAQSRALLKIVPRIDLQHIAAKREAAKNPAPPGQAKKRMRKGARAPQRLFNIDDVLAAGGDVQHSAGRVVIFNTKRYRDGFLYQWTNLDSMNALNVIPNLEELQLFEDKTKTLDAEGDPAAQTGAETALASLQKRVAHFDKGDVVRVLGGELKNLKAVIVAIKSDGDGQQLVVKPMLEALKHQELVFAAAEVVKFFKVGDHVEVLAGKHEKETGLVVRVDGDHAYIFSDINRREIQVFVSDTKLSAKVATGTDAIGKYQLFDMVMIGTQNVGVIIRIDKESVTVLTNNGVAQDVKHQAMGMKRSSRQAVALDQNQNQLALEDLCRLEQGANKGKQGTVIHLFRSFVFLHAPDEVKNGGVMVARSRHVALLGGEKKNQADNWSFPNQVSALMSPSRSGFGMKGKGGGKGGKGGKGKGKGKGLFGNDQLINRKVLIKSGANKGYQGLVKAVTLLTANIELIAKRRTVTIKIPNALNGGKITDVLEMIDNVESSGGPAAMAANSMFKPPDTPAHDTMPRTPAHGNDPLGTPGQLDEAWDPDVGHTPARDVSTPNWGDHSSAGGPGTPQSYGGGSAWDPSPRGGYTPTNGGYENYTGFAKPEYSPGPGTPGTPGYGNGTPNGFGGGTPGTVGTPGTPGTYGNTPGYGGTPGMAMAGPSEDDNWLLYAKNVLVKITDGPHQGKTGVIRNHEGIQAQVEISGDSTVTVEIGHMQPVPPTKKDNVVVISDADKGGTGLLIGIDGEDGIVKMSPSLDIKILRLDSLAKLAEEE